MSGKRRNRYHEPMTETAGETRQIAVDFTPIGYQGAAQHTYTVNCDGFHPAGSCPPNETVRVDVTFPVPS